MKEIIFVTVSMGGGGTERVISILANYYVQHNIKVTILMIADNRVEYELDDRVRVVSIAGATGGSFIARLNRLKNLRRSIEQNRDANIIAMGTVTAMFTLLATIGMPNDIVISERNDPNRLNHRPIRVAEKCFRNLLYKRSRKIVLQTEDVKECFPVSLIQKSVVIPNPLSRDLPKVDENFARDKTIITAGRLTEQKNHQLLICAFKRIIKKHPEYTLKIFGRGEMEASLKNIIQVEQLEDKVFLEGFSDNLYNELQRGGIYVSCSNWEGISNSLAEAVAMGIPTIATDCPVGGSRMLIRHEENGLLIPVGNEDALVEAIERFIYNDRLATKISTEGIQLRERLSEEVIAKQWLKLFDKGL